MNKLVMIAFTVICALLILSTPIKAEKGHGHAETVLTELKTGDANISGGVTAFDAYSLFYFGMPKAQCYQCSDPCNAYACCPGPNPQCCYVPGLGCRCCSS